MLWALIIPLVSWTEGVIVSIPDYCLPSYLLEVLQRGASIEYPQHMIL